MENLIDSSYFWGEIEIQGVFKNSVGTLMGEAGSAEAIKLNQYIKTFQRYYLDEMFFDGFEPNAEIIELLRNDDLKTSPIANYVYFFYKRSNESFSAPSGEKQMQIINTQIAESRTKMRIAWDRMVDVNRALHQKMFDINTFGDIDYLNDIHGNVDFSANVFNKVFDL
jgi:hypothetical protein